MHRFLKVLFVVLLLQPGAGKAQNIARKNISRLINADSSTVQSRREGARLYSTLLSKINNGQLGGYAPGDNTGQKLYRTDLTRLYSFDLNLTKGAYNLDSVYQYRIYEHWNFDVTNGIVTIDMQRMGPVRNIRGVRQVLFTADFVDIQPLLKNSSGLWKRLWQNYVQEPETKSRSPRFDKRSWQFYAIRNLDLSPFMDSIAPTLRDEDQNNDDKWGLPIYPAVVRKMLTAWEDENNKPGKQIVPVDGHFGYTKVDTQTLEDPTNGELVVRYVTKGPPERATAIRLLEHWTYDATRRQIKIEIEAIAPIWSFTVPWDHAGHWTNADFWVRYKDLNAVLPAIGNTYDMSPTLPAMIWKSFFMLDTKAIMIR